MKFPGCGSACTTPTSKIMAWMESERWVSPTSGQNMIHARTKCVLMCTLWSTQINASAIKNWQNKSKPNTVTYTNLLRSLDLGSWQLTPFPAHNTYHQVTAKASTPTATWAWLTALGCSVIFKPSTHSVANTRKEVNCQFTLRPEAELPNKFTRDPYILWYRHRYV